MTGAELGTSPFAPDVARRAVEDVLAGAAYRDVGPTLWQRFWSWVSEQLGRLLTATGGGIGSVLAGLALVAVVVVLVVAVLRFLRGARRDALVQPAHAGWQGRTAAEWAAEADRHAAAGRWRDAVRARYRELLADLADAGLLDDGPGRTTGEYRAELADRLPGARVAFDALTARFERAWYSTAPTTAADLDAVRAHTDQVRDAAGLRSRATAGAASA